jgi:PAS domain S-box-containing protein
MFPFSKWLVFTRRSLAGFACRLTLRGTTGAVERWYGTCTDIDDLKRAQEVLAENDGRLVEAQRIAKMGGWSWEPESGRVWWSDTLYELMGVDRNHFQPTFDNFLSILHPDDREHAIKRVKTIFSGSNGFASDLRVIRRQDGIQIWIHSQAKVVRSADGRILRVDGTDQDITERKLAEASLRESEHRFRNVLDNSPAIIFLKDLSGRYLFVNRYGADAVSIPQEDFVGKTAAEVLPPELAEQFERNDSLVQKTLRPIQFEETAAAPNGRLIAMLTTIFPLYLSDGAPYAICGIGQDISEQKRVQEERDRLWNLSPDPLCVVGSDGFFKQLSPAWRRLLGWTEEEMLSQPWLTFVHPDDHAASVRMGERLAAGEMVTGFINRYRCRNGDYRWFSWNATYVPASQRIYGFVRDVTEEQQLSEMARRYLHQ